MALVDSRPPIPLPKGSLMLVCAHGFKPWVKPALLSMPSSLALVNSLRSLCYIVLVMVRAATRGVAHEAERLILTTQRSRHRLDAQNGEEDSVAAELAALAYKLTEQKRFGEQAMTLSASDRVYWLRMPPAPPPFVQQTVQQRQASLS